MQLPPPSNEDLRIAARQFEYANRASVGGNHDIAIRCLQDSCRLAPGNLSYRQTLRKVEKFLDSVEAAPGSGGYS